MIRIGDKNFRTVEESIEWLMQQYKLISSEQIDASISRFKRANDTGGLPDPATSEHSYLVGVNEPYELFVPLELDDNTWTWLNLGTYPLAGPQGPQGIQGPIPMHEWFGTYLSFQNPNGEFDKAVDLKGETGDFCTIGIVPPEYTGKENEPYLDITTGNLYRYDGTQWQFLGTLKGQKGQDGVDGVTPEIGENGNWWINGTDTNVLARGTNGKSISIIDPVLSSPSLLPPFNTVPEMVGYLVAQAGLNTKLYMHLEGGSDWAVIDWQGAVGPQGPKGDSGQNGVGWWAFTGTTANNISEINSNMKVGDYVVFTGTGIASILGQSVNIGAVIKSTSQNNGTITGNIRGQAGQTGATGQVGATGPQGPKGETGATGTTPNITMSATTLPAGSNATVSRSGTNENPVFTIGIPKGDTGATGAQGPKGETGNTGAQGPKGDTGATGATGATGPQGPSGASLLKRHNIYIISSNWRITTAIINDNATPFTVASFKTYLQARGLTGITTSDTPEGPMLSISGSNRNNYGTAQGIAVDNGTLRIMWTSNTGSHTVELTPQTFQDKVTDI